MTEHGHDDPTEAELIGAAVDSIAFQTLGVRAPTSERLREAEAAGWLAPEGLAGRHETTEPGTDRSLRERGEQELADLANRSPVSREWMVTR
jgi:hypothetical protein